MRRIVRQGLLVLLSLTISSTGSESHAGVPKPEVIANYFGGYESNVFHSYSDRDKSGDMLNALGLRLKWRLKLSQSISHEIMPYVLYDLYPNYGDRNNGSVGLVYESTWRYSKKGKLSAEADCSRRNKDLVGDAGNVLARTLTKWQFDLALRHRMVLGDCRLEQAVGYFDDNYDERLDSITATPLLSYDYHGVKTRLRARYDITRRLRVQVTHDYEKRDYTERRTYTVQYGAFIGRPFEIRSFRENTISAELEYEVAPVLTVTGEWEYTSRKDNFEDFYGYTYGQYKMKVRLIEHTRHQSDVTVRFKDKNYPHYWNSSIGRDNRVWIDYADIQLEHHFEINPDLRVVASIRNYSKVSNDVNVEYRDITAGLGVELRY